MTTTESPPSATDGAAAAATNDGAAVVIESAPEIVATAPIDDTGADGSSSSSSGGGKAEEKKEDDDLRVVVSPMEIDDDDDGGKKKEDVDNKAHEPLASAAAAAAAAAAGAAAAPVVIESTTIVGIAETAVVEKDGDSGCGKGGDEEPPLPEIPSFYMAAFAAHYPTTDNSSSSSSSPPKKKLSLFQRYASAVARRPKLHLGASFVTAVVLSFIGLRFGEFEVSIDNSGWWSRGTTIGDRTSQEIVVNQNRGELFDDATGDVWEELRTVVQRGWDIADDDDEEDEEEDEDERRRRRRDRRLEEIRGDGDGGVNEFVCSGDWYGSQEMYSGRYHALNAVWKTSDAEKKDGKATESALSAESIYDICAAEAVTLAALEDDGDCVACPVVGGGNDEGREGMTTTTETTETKCVQPYSLVLMARQYLGDERGGNNIASDAFLTCDGLKAAWTTQVRDGFTSALKVCVGNVLASLEAEKNGEEAASSFAGECVIPNFYPTVVDTLFYGSDPSLVRYTSSYFATKSDEGTVDNMFEATLENEYDTLTAPPNDGVPLEGAYETTDRGFYDRYTDSIVARDMSLAVGSAGVTIVAMAVHTRSLFLTFWGLLQIILSFPIAYFVYYFIGGVVFFPFLNFIGIFVVFALGADDVFVAVDKWKNARRELPHATTEQIAALALPDAAYAMLLTSTTTAVAFFGTAICPVAPIVCFAVFVGLLIVFDYLMNIFLVFPALCIYDAWLQRGVRNCCVDFATCRRRRRRPKKESEEEKEETNKTDASKTTLKVDQSSSLSSSPVVFDDVEGKGIVKEKSHALVEEKEEEKPSLIHRILDAYYRFLHKFRWFVLVACAAAIVGCTVVATRLTLPVSSQVSILPESNTYQKNTDWSAELLSSVLAQGSGSEADIIWGITPADTGNHLDPSTFTTMELDESFDPRPEATQSYLLSFCDRIFAEPFAEKVYSDYICPINSFDLWLADQASAEEPSEEYSTYCEGADSVPVPPEVFDPCIIAWTKAVGENAILSDPNTNRVRIMQFKTLSNAKFDSPFAVLNDEWNAYEDFLDAERDTAPEGANGMFHSSIDFWWYDTNQQMLRTAYGAAGIALICAAFIVFISSRSFMLTLFAAISIGYVLVATTACLVGLGWELGFLESVLFSILIGISCDFIIHFGHAYVMYPGDVKREYRSHFALTHMGPSILAAAVTTFAGACIMIIAEITFFTKFAVILFMTILHSTIGSFVVFLTLCDCVGPSEPTKTYDAIRAKLCSGRQSS